MGKTGTTGVIRSRMSITDTSVEGDSIYAGFSRQGAVMVPRCLFFVEETANPSIVQAGQTVTVNPRRGSQDKEPWKSLDLSILSEQTIEASHVFDIHLGETLVPYGTLGSLRAVLPLRRGEYEVPTSNNGLGGIRLGGLSQRMRDRWRTVSNLWEANRSATTKMNLLEQLDYYGKLSSQLEWRREPGDRQVRVVYSGWGAPTAAVLHEDDAIVDYKLFWIVCRDEREAHYLLAIINSDTLADAVNRYTTPNWSGKTRDLQKHLWKLPIPEYDASKPLHVRVSEAGEAAGLGTATQLSQLHQDREKVTVTIARREIRKWLRASKDGKAVEEAVEELLGTRQVLANPPSRGR